jgi:hypothetical protein
VLLGRFGLEICKIRPKYSKFQQGRNDQTNYVAARVETLEKKNNPRAANEGRSAGTNYRPTIF